MTIKEILKFLWDCVAYNYHLSGFDRNYRFGTRDNLQEADLTKANFQGANLKNANLWRADLKAVAGVTVDQLSKVTTLFVGPPC